MNEISQEKVQSEKRDEDETLVIINKPKRDSCPKKELRDKSRRCWVKTKGDVMENKGRDN